ncbi:MAG TPA: hypothetical protein VN661_06335, partial [Candidatus Acidoferrales bacterium]|nr:hypothetical protein [Candidatus Acidoferrales bacterium]
MRTLSLAGILAVAALYIGGAARPCAAQQSRVFDWVSANDETLRLDPANYYTGRTYRPGPHGGGLHVDIKSQMPVTVFLTPASNWDQASRDFQMLPRLPQTCLREHVVAMTYVCQLGASEPMTLVIRDERRSLRPTVYAELGAAIDTTVQHSATNPIESRFGHIVSSGLTAAMAGGGSSSGRRFSSPNDVHIQYYAWNCVANCIQPEFRWIEQVKEKYDLTPLLKVYGGFAPDHDGTQVSIWIKAPIPMTIAMLPSQTADQLYANPDLLETALQKDTCQQRAAQSLQFQCTFNQADGPQSLIAVPAPGIRVPRKKVQIEMQAVECVDHCDMLSSPQQPQEQQQSQQQQQPQ